MVLLRLLPSLCVMKNLVHDGWTEENADRSCEGTEQIRISLVTVNILRILYISDKIHMGR